MGTRAASQIAAREAGAIATVQWRYAAEQRMISAVGSDLHRRARRTGASEMCVALAALADDLDKAKDAAIAALTRVVAPLLGFIGPSRVAMLIARQLVRRVTAVPGEEVDAVVVALRAYGVLLCVLEDRDLTTCTCLRRLAVSEVEERITSAVHSVVGHGLDSLQAGIPPRS
jgi:hypothetical protein